MVRRRFSGSLKNIKKTHGNDGKDFSNNQKDFIFESKHIDTKQETKEQKKPIKSSFHESTPRTAALKIAKMFPKRTSYSSALNSSPSFKEIILENVDDTLLETDQKKQVLKFFLKHKIKKRSIKDSFFIAMTKCISFLQENTFSDLLERKDLNRKIKQTPENRYLSERLSSLQTVFDDLKKEEERWEATKQWKEKYFSFPEKEIQFKEEEEEIQKTIDTQRKEREEKKKEIVEWTEKLRFKLDRSSFALTALSAFKEEASLYCEDLFGRLLKIINERYLISKGKSKTKTPICLLRETNSEIIYAMKKLSQQGAIIMTPRK